MPAPPSGIRLVPTARSDGRMLVLLDDRAAAAYASCVAPVVPFVEAGLSDRVTANRVVAVTSDPAAIRLEPLPSARRRFHRMSAELLAGCEAVLITDVRACYRSISAAAVERSLHRLGADRDDVRSVLRELRRFERAGVEGLPIGPEPSAVLANAVLSVLDEALESAGRRHVRWVDDVITFLPRATDAGAVLALTREVLGREGLELAADKTRLAVHPDHLLERAADVGSPIRHGPGSRGGNLRADANAVPGLPRADPLVPLER